MIDFLTFSSNEIVGGHRVFPLISDDCQGPWEYKISITKRICRVFYVLHRARRIVFIYYTVRKSAKLR